VRIRRLSGIGLAIAITGATHGDTFVACGPLLVALVSSDSVKGDQVLVFREYLDGK
jgi:hypothetical protein